MCLFSTRRYTFCFVFLCACRYIGWKLCSLTGIYIHTDQKTKNIVSSAQHTHTQSAFTNRHNHTTTPLLLSLSTPPHTHLSLSFSLSLCDGRTGSELCGWEEARTPRRTLIMQSLSFLPAPRPWHWPIAVTRGELGTFSLSFELYFFQSLSHKHTQTYTLLHKPHQTGPPPETVAHYRSCSDDCTTDLGSLRHWGLYPALQACSWYLHLAHTALRFTLVFTQTAYFYFHLSYLVVNVHNFVLLVHICGRPKVFVVCRGVMMIAISAFIQS